MLTGPYPGPCDRVKPQETPTLEMTAFPGVVAAAITPRGKQGEVDFGATFDLIDYLCRAGARGIALFSGAGEYPAFTIEERSRLVYLAVKRSRLPVLVGVGSATLDLSVALAREARDAGAAAILAPPPFFYRYEPDDIREFYLQFAEHVGLGSTLFLSNMPPLTSEVSAEAAAGLLETGRFAGIEDASGNWESFAALKAAAEGRSCQLLASDAVFTRARCGASGVLSMAACAVPELVMALDRAIGGSRRDDIERLDGRLQSFLEWSRRFPLPAIVKVATGMRGLKTGPLAVPLPPEKERLLDEFREWFRGWLPEMKKLAANA